MKITCLFFIILVVLCNYTLAEESIPFDVINEYRQKQSMKNVNAPIFGLRCKVNDKEYQLPLKRLHYNVVIINSLAEVEFLQEYENNLNTNIETEYFFAINSGAAFTSLKAQINEQVINGRIKDKEQARQEYDQAIKEGKTAVFGEIVSELHDIMKLNLGNLQAGKSATIILKYIEQLDVVLNKFWRFSIGNTFSDRSLSVSDPSYNLIKACNPQQISKLSPAAYPWYITVELKSPSKLTFLKSPSHPIQVQYKDEYTALINLDVSKLFYPNQEFVLLYRNSEINTPQIVLEQDKSDFIMPYAAQLTFFPDFNVEDVETSYKQYMNNSSYQFKFDTNNLKAEYIFIIDRSGSMSGDRIQITKEALVQLINLLPTDSYFNVISFGSTYEPLFEASQSKSQSTVKQAIEQIQNFDSNLGGTNIYEPLNFTLSSKEIPHYPKSIFLLTDGQVENEDLCVKLIKNNERIQNFRLYSIGIGNGVSKSFIQNMALEGRGLHLFVEDLEQMHEKLQFILKDSLTPFLENVQIRMQQKYIKAIAPLPETIKVIRKNQPLILYIFFGENLEDNNVQLSCYDATSNQQKTFQIKVEISKVQNTSMIHKIGIHKIIKSMLSNAIYQNNPLSDVYFFEGESGFEKIKQLSILHQVLSEFTAFILVNENDVNMTNTTPTKIDIPVIQSEDYDGSLATGAKSSGRGWGKSTAKYSTASNQGNQNVDSYGNQQGTKEQTKEQTKDTTDTDKNLHQSTHSNKRSLIVKISVFLTIAIVIAIWLFICLRKKKFYLNLQSQLKTPEPHLQMTDVQEGETLQQQQSQIKE